MIKQPVGAFPEQKVVRFSWLNMGDGDSGGEISWISYADRSIQAFGTFGSVMIEGSNDGINWSSLRNTAGDDLIFTSSRIEQVLEVCLYVRPVVTGAGADVNVVMVGRMA